jgi:4-hydroxyphenylpyruvate dioxygenase
MRRSTSSNARARVRPASAGHLLRATRRPPPRHGEPLAALRERGILVDGTTDGAHARLLMQIFSSLMVGPVFFEFIQRKGDEGFGEGNIAALFRSMEEDQLRRGTLATRESAD